MEGPIGNWQEYNDGWAMGIARSGNYAYVASLNGLFVYDLSNPAEPRQVIRLLLPKSANDVSIVGDRAYVACSTAGLAIVDISVPTEPKLLGVAATQAEIWDVSVAGDYAYLASTRYGLEVVDISNESSPTRVSGFETVGSAGGVRVAGDIVYLGDGLNGLGIFNVSNPLAPTRITTYRQIGWGDDIVVDGNFAYVADSQARVVELDVTDPGRPVRKRTSLPLQPKSMLLQGDELFVCANREFAILSIKTGETNMPRFAWPSAQFHRDLAVFGEHVVMASDIGGLHVLNVEDRSNIRMVAHVGTSEDASRIVARGDLALVAGGKAGLALLDISIPREPKTLARLGNASDVTAAEFIDDDKAIVLFDGIPTIIDFAERTNVSSIATLPESQVTGLAMSANLAVIAKRETAQNGGAQYKLKVYDLSDPENPVARGESGIPASAKHIQVDSTRAYVALTADGFAIVDIEDLDAPRVLSVTDTVGNVEKWAVRDGKAFVAAYSAGLLIYDVTNSSLPAYVTNFADVKYATGVTVSNTSVYVANGFSRELVEIDVSDITAPKKKAAYTHSGQPRDVIVHGENMFVAHGNGGVSVFAMAEAGIELTLEFSIEGGARVISAREATGRALSEVEVTGLKLHRSDDLIGWEQVPTQAMLSNGMARFTTEDARTYGFFRIAAE